MAQVLLVQVGAEQTRVWVGGFLYGRTLGNGGTRVVVRRARWGDFLLDWRVVILPYQRGDVEPSEGLLFCPGGRDELGVHGVLGGARGWAGQI